MTQANTPDIVFRAGGMSVAVWKKEPTPDGRPQFSIRVQKRYLDSATQEWKTADYLFPDDLPRLILAAQEAYRYVTLREKEQNSDVAA